MKRNIMYGWKSGNGKQLFVYQNEMHWGVHARARGAAVFETIPQCIEHWQSKHAIPENYNHLLKKNHLQFFNAKTKQQILHIH